MTKHRNRPPRHYTKIRQDIEPEHEDIAIFFYETQKQSTEKIGSTKHITLGR